MKKTNGTTSGSGNMYLMDKARSPIRASIDERNSMISATSSAGSNTLCDSVSNYTNMTLTTNQSQVRE
uniref:Uncharacterized protein n=1 Tax=Panagrolaimus sp. JU765 TaxID=591449 RepID=A0AC34Q1I0_9BILA